MEKAAYHHFYDSIHDFKKTALLVEEEIKRHGIRNDSSDTVPGMNGRKHHDMWVSMKAVSHFNLGTALELMLKLLLFLNKVPLKKVPKSQRHLLTILYDAIPDPCREQLESAYVASRRASGNYELFMFKKTASATEAPLPPPPTRNINSLRSFFEYLDKDVVLWQKRYSWEHVEDGRWRYYLGDISVFVELIDRVMRDIARN